MITQGKLFAHHLFRLTGYDFKPHTPEYFTSLRRKKYIRDHDIDLVLDIGAGTGTYVEKIRRSGFAGKVVSFEPQSRSFKRLQQHCTPDPFWWCENVAVGKAEKKEVIHLSGYKNSSSILKMSQEHINAMPESSTVGSETVCMVPLDSFFNKYTARNNNVYMKIDVQGYEKHVLEGAKKTLQQTSLIEMELSVTPLYDTAPILNEMIDYMDNTGFTLISISPIFFNPQTGHMLQADGIFARRQAKQ